MRTHERVGGPAIKICGLTREQDVVVARDLGVWAVGFVFADSPRRVEPSVARSLAEGAGLGRRGKEPSARDGRGIREEGLPLTVGVFTDTDVEGIVGVVDEVGLDAVQLHGVNGPSVDEVVEALSTGERTTLIIQAVPVDVEERDAAGLREAVAGAASGADVVLLDTRVSVDGTASADGALSAGSFGGSGKSFRWALAGEAEVASARAPVLIAGGVDPENVLTALAESGAWGVDVSSGVESAPGVKDATLMKRLVARVKEGR